MASRSWNITGASVLCYINGKLYANVTRFSFASSTENKVIHTIDRQEGAELMSTVAECSGNMEMYRQIGSGGLQGAGMASFYTDLPRQKYFSLVLLERRTKMVIFQANMVQVVSESWSIPAKGRMTGNMQFKALDWNNEVKPLR